MATLVLGRRADRADAPPVAIKVIHEHLSEDWQFVRMFVDEALISVRLRHPNVIRVDELGEQNNTYFLVMEYVHGCSLAQLLRSMGRQGRRMRPEIAVWIAQQVAAGLHAAHELTGDDGAVIGVIHRDVSPQNVLLSVDGEVKLLDFGIAKARGRAERTEAGVIKGKVRYMSPEQAAGEDIDRRVDIYALGVVLWEMLTMRRYVDGKNEVELIRKVRAPDRIPPSVKAQGIDPRIDEAVMAALTIDVRQRPPTAADFYQLLAAAVPEGTIGPSHVAELIRVFVGEEIEAAAKALPAAIGGPIAKRVREGAALPGDSTPGVDDVTRVAELTHDGPKEVEPAKAPAKPPAREEQTRSMVQARPPEPPVLEAPPPPAPPPPAPPPPAPPEPPVPQAPINPPREMVRFDDADEEATIQSAELVVPQIALEKPQEFSPPAPTPPPAPEPRAQPELIAPQRLLPPPSAPAALEAPAADSSDEKGEAGVGSWIVRVLLIVLLAFGVGAGVAIAWVRWGHFLAG